MTTEKKINVLILAVILLFGHVAYQQFQPDNVIRLPDNPDQINYQIDREGLSALSSSNVKLEGIAAQNGFPIGPNPIGTIYLEWEDTNLFDVACNFFLGCYYRYSTIHATLKIGNKTVAHTSYHTDYDSPYTAYGKVLGTLSRISNHHMKEYLSSN